MTDNFFAEFIPQNAAPPPSKPAVNDNFFAKFMPAAAQQGNAPQNSAAPATASPGPLSNTGSEGLLSGAAKGVATGAITGLSRSLGTVGNLSNFANYLVARGESAITGRLRGLELTLSDFLETERLSILAQTEQEVKRLGDLARLRAIKEYRRLHLPNPTSTKPLPRA